MSIGVCTISSMLAFCGIGAAFWGVGGWIAQCSILMLGFFMAVISVLIMRSRTFFLLARELVDDFVSEVRLLSDFSMSGLSLSLEIVELSVTASSSANALSIAFSDALQGTFLDAFGVTFSGTFSGSFAGSSTTVSAPEVGGLGKLARSGVFISAILRSGAEA